MTEFYRFRSKEKLLREPFQELERQTIFFAGAEELNDPVEGFRDIVWDGDPIVWSNLFKHYVHCVHWTYLMSPIFGGELGFEPSDIPVEQRWDEMPTPKASELFDVVWSKVREECELEALASRIAALEYSGIKHKVRRDELLFYLQSIHMRAFTTIEKIFVERSLRTEDQRILTKSSQKTLLTRNGYFDLIRQVPNIDSSSSATLYSVIAGDLRTIPLRHSFDPQDVGKRNGKFLVIDYPEVYIEQLRRLLWPEWYTACFVKENHNSSIWANYGDAHKGACLIFEANERADGASLPLNQRTGASYSGNGDVREHWEVVPMNFQEVEYLAKPEEVDFFQSMGRLRGDALLKLWYTDQDGNVSDCAEHVYGSGGGIEAWQKNYWDNFHRDARFKTTDWEYEQEFRLVLNPLLDGSLSAPQRTLTYDFNSLKGIVFGLKTSDDDKLEMIDIIRRKCRENHRTDFQFLQAYYSPETGDIRSHNILMNLNNC